MGKKNYYYLLMDIFYSVFCNFPTLLSINFFPIYFPWPSKSPLFPLFHDLEKPCMRPNGSSQAAHRRPYGHYLKIWCKFPGILERCGTPWMEQKCKNLSKIRFKQDILIVHHFLGLFWGQKHQSQGVFGTLILHCKDFHHSFATLKAKMPNKTNISCW